MLQHSIYMVFISISILSLNFHSFFPFLFFFTFFEFVFCTITYIILRIIILSLSYVSYNVELFILIAGRVLEIGYITVIYILQCVVVQVKSFEYKICA